MPLFCRRPRWIQKRNTTGTCRWPILFVFGVQFDYSCRTKSGPTEAGNCLHNVHNPIAIIKGVGLIPQREMRCISSRGPTDTSFHLLSLWTSMRLQNPIRLIDIFASKCFIPRREMRNISIWGPMNTSFNLLSQLTNMRLQKNLGFIDFFCFKMFYLMGWTGGRVDGPSK